MAACTASTRACCTAVAAPTGRRAPPARAAALPAPSGASARRAAAGAGGRSLPPPSATPTARGASSPAASRKMVEDVMTKGVYTVGPDATLDEALQLLVSKRITGLPVVDGEGRVIGVISDFDLLSLDVPDIAPAGTFPALGGDWDTFFNSKEAALKGASKTVGEVMTIDPVVVRGSETIESAARMLLARKVRRLPVVDSDGRLIGLFSRSDVIKVALEARQAALGKE